MKVQKCTKNLKNVSTLLVCLALAAMITACSRGGDDGAAADTTDLSGWKTYESHEALVEAAREEGSLKVLVGLDDAEATVLEEGFMKAYPFIEASVEEGAGDQVQKTILTIQAGQFDYDSMEFSQPPNYPQVLPHLAGIDIMKMVKAGTLDIPEEMVNPDQPNTASFGSEKGTGLAWNKDLVSESDVPSSYEDMLDPKYRGEFIFSVETRHVVALAEAWGEDEMLEWAKAMGEQDPVWTDSNSAGMTVLAAGEHPYFFLPHYASALRVQKEIPDKIGFKMLDPVPVHLGEIYGILKDAEHPASALLFYEYMASQEAQDTIREMHPEYSSIFADKAGNDAVLDGNEPAITGWDVMSQMVEWENEIVDSWGFPTSEVEN